MFVFTREKENQCYKRLRSAVIVESRPARTKRGIGRNQAAVTSLIRPLEMADHNSKILLLQCNSVKASAVDGILTDQQYYQSIFLQYADCSRTRVP